MEQGFSEWVILEYAQIIKDVGSQNLIISSLPSNTTEKDIPKRLLELGLQWTTSQLRDVPKEFGLPEMVNGKVCLLDPRAKSDLKPEDGDQFEYFVFGGILGDHPPRDRTSELMQSYPDLLVGKRLGDKQMTTDTAVRTTQLIMEKGRNFEQIKFWDYPEFRFNKYEATEMPFRYVIDEKDGKPILPEGMLELIKKDSQQSLDDLL